MVGRPGCSKRSTCRGNRRQNVFASGSGRDIILIRARRGILVEISYGKGHKEAIVSALGGNSRVIHRGRRGSPHVLFPLQQNDQGGANMPGVDDA